MSEIWDNEDPDLSGSKLNILLCLADHANDDGVCWPSIARIARRSRIDRSNVMDHIKALVKDGYLKIERRNGTSNVYTVSVKRGSGGVTTSGGSTTPTSGGSTTGVVAVAPPESSSNRNLEPSKDLPSLLFTQPDVSEQAPLTTSASSGKKEPKQEQPASGVLCQPDVPGSSHKEMFAALADLCKVDPNLVNGRLGAHVKSLRKAGYTVADLERFGQWWYANDFRGKRGEPPALGVVLTDLPRSVAPPPPSVAPPDNQPHVDSLRSWHRTRQNAAWSSHIASQRGTYPSDAKGYLEWYEEEYGGLGEDELRRLWREYKREQESE